MIAPLFKIISYDPTTRTVEFHYYTRELMDAMQPKWDQMLADALRGNPNLDVEAFKLFLSRTYYAGGVSNVTLYDDLALTDPDVLVDAIMKMIPIAWLEVKHNALVNPPDMKLPHQLVGVEVAGQVDPITNSLKATIPVTTVGGTTSV